MAEIRPNPDALLKRVQAEEARQLEGKLKIFFGANPGVGKTYAMLEAAHEQRRDGVDIVIGVVETHGRAETEALLPGLEVLAPPHGGVPRHRAQRIRSSMPPLRDVPPSFFSTNWHTRTRPVFDMPSAGRTCRSC